MTATTIPDQLDTNMSRALKLLEETQVDSPEYPALVDQIAKLHKMREDNKPSTIDSNVLVAAAANLAGIILVTQHERTHVIVSKAFGMLFRIK